MKRQFLLLQGVCSPFFAALADRLRADGHGVYKINFNVGDLAYWGGRPAVSFRGRIEDLKSFLSEIYESHGITDQILFGDRRPVHRPAVERASGLGIRTHVFEEGYFRPHWVTLEREGVNGHSLLPRDPDWFWSVGGDLPGDELATPFRSPFWIRATHDVLYHSASALNTFLYPRYRNHCPIPAPLEYMGYLRRFSMNRYWAKRDAQTIERLVTGQGLYYVLPLQLETDAQIRDHSRFESMDEVITEVMGSFAHFAPAGSRLVIKNHPLDMTLQGYQSVVRDRAKQFGLQGQVDYLETGNLERLLCHAAGVVTVNSTVGGVSLGVGCPTIALSDPIYNLPGLTFQGTLKDFWRDGEPPHRELFRRFRNAVIHATQVNGSFYNETGIALAVENSKRILEGEVSPLESLMQ